MNFKNMLRNGFEDSLRFEGITKNGVLILIYRDNKTYALGYISRGGEYTQVTTDILLFSTNGYFEYPAEEKGEYFHLNSTHFQAISLISSEEGYMSLLSVIGENLFFNALNSLKEYVHFVKNKPETNFLNSFTKNEFLYKKKKDKQVRYLIDSGYERFVNEFLAPGRYTEKKIDIFSVNHRLKVS